MRITPETVAEERRWTRDRVDVIVPLINEVRSALGERFGTEVGLVEEGAYRSEVDAVFAEGDRAVNVAALIRILRDLDVVDDYPGFVVDELLGRELAATIAGNHPFRLLAEATFHYADLHTHDSEVAGGDDLDAALAAGFQTRLPGWAWTAAAGPFDDG